MKEFIVGLALAAVSALGYIAYAHPLGYRRLMPLLRAVWLAAGLGGSIWNVSNAVTASAILHAGDPGKAGMVTTAADEVALSFWFFLFWIAAIAAIEGFLRLPELLAEEPHEDQPGERENKPH